MISAWHLLWIIPISVAWGAFMMILLVASGGNRSDDE